MKTFVTPTTSKVYKLILALTLFAQAPLQATADSSSYSWWKIGAAVVATTATFIGGYCAWHYFSKKSKKDTSVTKATQSIEAEKNCANITQLADTQQANKEFRPTEIASPSSTLLIQPQHSQSKPPLSEYGIKQIVLYCAHHAIMHKRQNVGEFQHPKKRESELDFEKNVEKFRTDRINLLRKKSQFNVPTKLHLRYSLMAGSQPPMQISLFTAAVYSGDPEMVQCMVDGKANIDDRIDPYIFEQLALDNNYLTAISSDADYLNKTRDFLENNNNNWFLCKCRQINLLDSHPSNHAYIRDNNKIMLILEKQGAKIQEASNHNDPLLKEHLASLQKIVASLDSIAEGTS